MGGTAAVGKVWSAQRTSMYCGGGNWHGRRKWICVRDVWWLRKMLAQRVLGMSRSQVEAVCVFLKDEGAG